MYISIVGIVMLVVFVAVIVSKKLSALTALIAVPLVFGLIAGFGMETFTYAAAGMGGVASTFILLTFAILYFGIMLCAGLFDPLSSLVIRFMKGDPLKVVVGTAVLSALVSLDGDGTTTFMICTTALIPVYNFLKIPKVYLAIFVLLPNAVMNFLPWGGPTARMLSVLDIDSGVLLQTLLPFMGAGIIAILAMAYVTGLKERKRLGTSAEAAQAGTVQVPEEEKEFRRPQLIIFNLILSLAVVVSVVAGAVSGPAAFGCGCGIALIVNYRDLKTQKRVIEYNAEGILNVVLMVLGAGILLGVLSESGMADSISQLIVSAIPDSLGNAFNFILALVSGPALWILNNDAFYFGLLPVLAETASSYGFTNLQIGIASLVGQALRASSPVIPALYLLIQYVDVDFGEFQKKVLPYSLILMTAFLAAAFVLGVF